MSRSVALIALLLVASGCAGNRPPAPASGPPVDASPGQLDESHAATGQLDENDASVVDRVEPDAARQEAECARIAELAADGDHKPAADALTALRRAGDSCPAEIEAAAIASVSRLAEADALLHDAQSRREGGDLDGAVASLRAALEVYPRYEWAAKLLRDLEERRAAQPDRGEAIAHQLRLARAAEERHELDRAARLTLAALEANPTAAELKLEAAAFAERLGLALFSEGALESAKKLWEAALALVGESPKLADYLEQVERRLDSLEKIRDSG